MPLPREDVTFESAGLRCAAWLYRAPGPGPTPIVVMGHGLGGTRELGLEPYARRFQEAGITALVFDYRHYGGSEGEPRELLSVGKQLADFRAAIAFARSLPGVDPARVAAWGSSFGGGHVTTLAAEGHGLAAAVAQVPFSDGLASSLRIPPLTALRVTFAALGDLLSSAVGLGPRYLALLGAPGEVALMSAPDCAEGYGRIVPEEARAAGRWQNRVTARTGLAVSFYSPARRASRIACPILFCVAEGDSIAPAGPTTRAARTAPRGELLTLPGGHFDYYLGEGYERVVGAEVEFLTRHLGVAGAAERPAG